MGMDLVNMVKSEPFPRKIVDQFKFNGMRMHECPTVGTSPCKEFFEIVTDDQGVLWTLWKGCYLDRIIYKEDWPPGTYEEEEFRYQDPRTAYYYNRVWDKEGINFAWKKYDDDSVVEEHSDAEEKENPLLGFPPDRRKVWGDFLAAQG